VRGKAEPSELNTCEPAALLAMDGGASALRCVAPVILRFKLDARIYFFNTSSTNSNNALLS